jgi:methyl-accepting chemotaxis protein
VWRHWSLSTKFTVLLAAAFLGGALIGGLVLWRVLQVRAEAEVVSKSSVLLQTINAVRSYTSDHIDPLLQNSAAMQDKFIPETVPAFSAREVFEHLRQDKKYQGFFYKEATLNPTNLRDQADSFETDLVNQMRRESRSEYSAFRTREGQPTYYIAHPIRVTAERCLTCHGDPAVASKSMLNAYGAQNGFGWKLNDVIGAQIMYVPADEVLQASVRTFSVAAGAMIATLVLVLVLVNFLLRRDIIRPIGILGTLARKLSADQLNSDDLQSGDLLRVAARNDELGHTAQVFRQMANEVHARTQSLKEQVRELRIEIDAVRQHQSVTAVVETDFFRNLQSQAREMRSRRDEQSSSRPADDLPADS